MKGRIPSLDGLRGICILLVLSSHAVGASNFVKLYFLGDFAAVGLVVFFVLSGFLITTVLIKELSRRGTISLKNFYIRRFLRIFPVAYLYIAVVSLLSFFGLIGLRRHDLAFAVSYLVDFHHDRSWYVGHLWYLTVEEQFYLVWPATVVVLGLRRSFLAACACLALIPVGGLVMPRLLPSLPPSLGIPDGTASILTGCLLALKFEWLQTRRIFASRLFALALLVAVAVRFYAWNVGRPVHGLGYLINILIALTVFRCVSVPNDVVGRILNSKALMFVGGLSYSIYIWQQLFLPPAPLGSPFPWNVLAAVTVALASFYVVERPCLKLKNRFVRAVVERPTRGETSVLHERLA